MKPQTELTPALPPRPGEPRASALGEVQGTPGVDASGSPDPVGGSPRTPRQRLLLIATGMMFFAWIGYLLLLVQTRPQAPGGGPIVVSRPQLLISELNVVARVESLEGPVIVKEVLYPRALKNTGLEGNKILVTNLDLCGRWENGQNQERDFTGAGDYILPSSTKLAWGVTAAGLAALPAGGGLLVVTQPPGEVTTDISYEVVRTPASPGYPAPSFKLPGLSEPEKQPAPGPPRIYRATKANLEQLQLIHKPE